MPRVAFCPHPPLLAAAGAVGDVPEVEPVRRAALDAVRRLVADAPARVVVLAAEDPSSPADEGAGGTLQPHGLDVHAGGSDLRLGLAHTVGAWLLDRAGWSGPRTYVGSITSADLDDAAVLVVADGTATRSATAPGHLDDRATPFDATVAAALADGDADTLGGIDLDLATALWCQGAPAWRTVGDAVAARLHTTDDEAEGPAVEASLLVDDAPLGVGWFVAVWDVP